MDARVPLLPSPFADWFSSRGWQPRAHQLELVRRAEAGSSTLLIAPTGAGKTLAHFSTLSKDVKGPAGDATKTDAAKLAVRDQIQAAVADVAGRAGELATGRRPDASVVTRVVNEVMAK